MGTRSTGTALRILAATKVALLESGYADLSTRRIVEEAGVPLSQIHYHFGSKQQLVLALLEDENERRLARQAAMYGEDDQPLSVQWQQACDYLDEDLESGYVRVLMEMTAAGWSDDRVAAAVRGYLSGWMRLLTGVMDEFGRTHDGLGPFSAVEAAALAGAAFLGVEVVILLGFDEDTVPGRAALRRIGEIIRAAERAPEVV